MTVGIHCADHATLSVRKVGTTSQTSGGRSVGIVRSWTKATEFSSPVFVFEVEEWHLQATQRLTVEGHDLKLRSNPAGAGFFDSYIS
jgi:hypothetical protein